MQHPVLQLCLNLCSQMMVIQRVQVLPEVYGGSAELVPVDEATLRRLAQQQLQKQTKQAAKQKGSATEAAKSSRIGSAGRAISRWSGSAWGVAKKPAVVSQVHLPLPMKMLHWLY